MGINCKDCGDWVERPKTNQRRCGSCIEDKPHRGRHIAGKLGEKYIKQARARLAANIRHWNISMGYRKLIEMFPDFKGR